jgi:hypothetical protein
MQLNRIIWCLFVAMILFACNATRLVKPLPKDELQVGAGFGGALIQLGDATIPIPLTNVYAAYGVKENTSAFASIHTTALLFGVFQTDLGFTQQLLKQKGYLPALSVSPIANLMLDKWEGQFSLYPQLDINAYWNYGKKKHLVYTSLNNWFELRNQRAHGETQKTHWLPSIGLGHQWSGKKYNLQLETKYLAPNQSNQNLVVDYVSFGNNGAIGVYIGLTRQF